MGESAQQKYKTKLRAKGLCANCPTPTRKYLCEYHAQLNRKYKRAYRERHSKPSTRSLCKRPWVQELLKLESFTAARAGQASGLWGSDAINRIRQSPSLELTVLGKAPNANHYRTSLYNVRVKEQNRND